MPRKEGTRVASRKSPRVSTRPRASASQPRNSFMTQNSSGFDSRPTSKAHHPFGSIVRAVQNTAAFMEGARAMALNPILWQTVLRALIFLIVSVNLYAIAWGTYATFYAKYIPIMTSVTPVYFNFANDPPSVKLPAVFDNKPMLFKYGQPYDISLELEVPESENNLALGNFMVRLELQNQGGRTLFVSERPSIMIYRSALLRRLSTLVYSIPLLLDLKSEHQILVVPLAERFMDDYDDIITDVELTISNQLLQIYSSRLRIDAHLTGLRYLMYSWPVTTATFFTAFFFIAEIIFCLIAWRAAIYMWARIKADTVNNEISFNQPNGASAVCSTSTQPLGPDSPSVTMPYTEEEEWERLSSHLSIGALTPPNMTSSHELSHQSTVNTNSNNVYSAQFSDPPPQSYLRGESKQDIDLLRFMSQPQDQLASSSQHKFAEVEQQTRTLVACEDVEGDSGLDQSSSADICSNSASLAFSHPMGF